MREPHGVKASDLQIWVSTGESCEQKSIPCLKDFPLAQEVFALKGELRLVLLAGCELPSLSLHEVGLLFALLFPDDDGVEKAVVWFHPGGDPAPTEHYNGQKFIRKIAGGDVRCGGRWSYLDVGVLKHLADEGKVLPFSKTFPNELEKPAASLGEVYRAWRWIPDVNRASVLRTQVETCWSVVRG